ncbi:hypothetical protein JL09_g7012 [Pichia kudriavzevii]|uniref:Uncharacterized protein n=1 Tax=Pichia kudriavzevii TaxID=4909 RepID=A0A099NKC3_PICKU|nr:hypothetical protein JL09_g7012 [Pichia kudriavzevii]
MEFTPQGNHREGNTENRRDMVEVYTATYSHIDVYESTIDGIQLMHLENSWFWENTTN